MKKYIITSALIATTALFSLSGCTDKFDEYNRDPYAARPDKQFAQYVLGGITQMESSIYFNYDNSDWAFQIEQNLSSDIYSGYLAPPTPFGGGQNNANYFMMEGWNSWSWTIYYNNVMKPWTIIKRATIDLGEKTEVYAVAQILKVMGANRLTDTYGPMPYSHYGEEGVSTPYDSQEEIYTSFFRELDEADATLTAFAASGSRENLLQVADKIFAGDYSKWRRVLNSLRLRLALRISKVNPTLAKTEGEKALNHSAGLMEDFDMMMPTDNMKNPLNILAYAYDDTRMSADMESILVGLKDPRVGVYFSFATDEAVVAALGKSAYKGIRQGINAVDKNLRVKYSNLGAPYTDEMKNKTPIKLMTAGEVYFSRAEAALRGWASSSRTVEELYTLGVKASFKHNGLTEAQANTYLADATSKPIDYIDYKNADYNARAASTITVKWDNGDTDERKLERIITQKWIAMFPEGMEAWSEFRRTGYPRLFPIVVNNSAGTISSTEMIRRLPFPTIERTHNRTAFLRGIELLNASNTATIKGDLGGARLWWDTNAGASSNGSNF